MNNEKTKSVLAYLFVIIGGLIVLMMKDSERRTKICAAQSVTIFIVFFIIRFVSGFIPLSIPYLEYIIDGIYLIFMVRHLGFEPRTFRLRVCCSSQLS